MTEMKPNIQNKTCPSCGAPLVSEICPYCGIATGLNTVDADMEYPILECKESSLNFWNFLFPLMVVVTLGGSGLIFLVVAILFDHQVFMIALSAILFELIALYFLIRSLSRYFKVKTKGKIIKATVYGYINDNFTINNQHAQRVKLLIQTQNGPRFILYSLGSTLKPYGVNDNIDVMVYENYFMILKKKETVNW